MSRPPIKAIEAIKNYCEKTQCRRCVFGYEEQDYHYVGCRLMETTPCDWDAEPLGEKGGRRMKIDGTKYKCDRCGVEKFLSNEQIAMEGGLTRHGVYKITVPKKKDLHFCESCFTEFLRFRNEKEETS